MRAAGEGLHLRVLYPTQRVSGLISTFELTRVEAKKR
jgi:hypothetical protein